MEQKTPMKKEKTPMDVVQVTDELKVRCSSYRRVEGATLGERMGGPAAATAATTPCHGKRKCRDSSKQKLLRRLGECEGV